MKYKVTLNGRTYEIEVERGEALVLDEYPATADAPAADESVKTPLPGTVLEERRN